MSIPNPHRFGDLVTLDDVLKHITAEEVRSSLNRTISRPSKGGFYRKTRTSQARINLPR